MTESKLLPCPFCGKSTHVSLKMGYQGVMVPYISCWTQDCGAYGSLRVQADTKEETIGRWNTRTVNKAHRMEAALETSLRLVERIIEKGISSGDLLKYKDIARKALNTQQ